MRRAAELIALHRKQFLQFLSFRFEGRKIMSKRLENNEGAVHRSPPPGIGAVVFVLLFIASIVANIIMTGGAPYPMRFPAHRGFDETTGD